MCVAEADVGIQSRCCVVVADSRNVDLVGAQYRVAESASVDRVGGGDDVRCSAVGSRCNRSTQVDREGRIVGRSPSNVGEAALT